MGISKVQPGSRVEGMVCCALFQCYGQWVRGYLGLRSRGGEGEITAISALPGCMSYYFDFPPQLKMVSGPLRSMPSRWFR